MEQNSALKAAVLSVCLVGLAACSSGGGSDNNGGSVNQAPTVSIAAVGAVDEFDTVTLSGSASDADGDSLTYSWTQTAGPAVTINNAGSATASFDAPDVLATDTPVSLTFELSVSDGTATRTANVTVTVNDAGLGANSPPTADAGSDSTVLEMTSVDLDGTGSSDPDGTALSYSWVQTAGPNVAITDADMAVASFTAPDVAPGVTEQFTFELTVDDGTDSDTDTVTVGVSEALSLVTVAGRLTYERPMPNAVCRLDFASPVLMPVRLATVMLLDSANNELAVSKTDLDGNYTFADINANTDVRVRVRAELVQTTGPQTYEVYVRDNVCDNDPGTPGIPDCVALENRPIYEVEWGLFNTGSANISNADFTAVTGWTGSGYDDQQRRAAPLAILDNILKGVLLVTGADPDVDLGRLSAYWNVNNTYSRTERWNDPDNGQLITAYYSGGTLFLRGDAVGRFPESSINTDEFDEQVVLHEWGHFFEDQLSRSDSVGGYHQLPGVVDARVAFGEGWGYGIGAIAANAPVGCDTAQPGSVGSLLDLENFNSRLSEQGFYNEMSIATLFWDLFDTDVDGTDNDSIGFAPIYDTMTGFQRNTEALTTVFPFATGLRQNVDPVDIAFIDSQLTRENIDTSSLDIWGSGQPLASLPAQWANGTDVLDVLPLYTELTVASGTQNLCVNVNPRVNDAHNSPGLWRYLYFTANGSQSLTLTIQANPVPPATTFVPDPGDPAVRDRSDPDVFLYRNGIIENWGRSSVDDLEVFDMGQLAAGTYALAFQDWRYDDDESATDLPYRAPDYPDQVCFDFTLSVN